MMNKKLSDLTEEELADMDLDELLMMSEEMQNSNKDNKDKAKESLKKAGTKTLDISKKVAVQATEVSKIIGSKTLEKLQDEQFQENVIYYLISFLSWIARILLAPAGMLAYIFYIVLVTKTEEKEQDGESFFGAHLLLLVAPTVLILVTLFVSKLFIVLLLPVILVEYYILILMYGNNWSKKYSKKLGIMNPFTIYFNNPIKTTTLDNDLEKKLFGDSKSKSEQGCIYTEKTYHSAQGDIRKLYFRDCGDLTVETDKLSDDYITKFGLLPIRVESDVFYIKDGNAYQSIDYVLGLISQSELIRMIKENDKVNIGFKEIEEELKMKAMKDELDNLVKLAASKKLPEEVGEMLKIIYKNKKWGFSIWNVGDNLKGNKKYFKVRCQLTGNSTMKTVNNLIPEIERELRREVIIRKKPNDLKSFDITVLLADNLPDVKISTEKMFEDYNKKGQILIGDSFTGFQAYDFSIKNLQAYWTSGGPGAGKSWTNIFLLKNLIQLRNIDGVIPKISEFFIVSDSKVADYRFLKDKAFLASGPENVLKLLNYLIRKCEEREALFNEKGVNDILDYNKKIGYMSPFVFVEDEYENSVQTNMKNFDKDLAKDEINQASAKLHRIMRSAGGISITSTQSAILDKIGDVGRYVNIKFFGRNNNSDVKASASAQLADKFNELGQEGARVQGLVGFQSKENLLKNVVFLDKDGTSLIKVPILEGEVNGIDDIENTKDLAEEILNGTTDDASTSYASGLSDDDI